MQVILFCIGVVLCGVADDGIGLQVKRKEAVFLISSV